VFAGILGSVRVGVWSLLIPELGQVLVSLESLMEGCFASVGQSSI